MPAMDDGPEEYVEPGCTACLECGHVLVMGVTDACPECGSLRRGHTANAGLAPAGVTAGSAKARATEWDAGYYGGKHSKPARVRTTEMSLTRDDGIERARSVNVDHAGDWYEETVVEPDGTTRHHRGEPLSRHTGHGSARPTGSRRSPGP